MPSLSFVIQRQPIPKQRPRVYHGHGYTPKRTVEYERFVHDVAICAMCAEGLELFTGDVAIEVIFYRKGKARADIDNMLKAIFDGLNSAVWQDDNQVVQVISVVKYGSPQGYSVVTVKGV